MSLFASVSPLQFKCELFCTFLFGNQGAPKACAGLGATVDRVGVGRWHSKYNRRQFPNWELAACWAIPATLMWRLEASFTDGLADTGSLYSPSGWTVAHTVCPVSSSSQANMGVNWVGVREIGLGTGEGDNKKSKSPFLPPQSAVEQEDRVEKFMARGLIANVQSTS